MQWSCSDVAQDILVWDMLVVFEWRLETHGWATLAPDLLADCLQLSGAAEEGVRSHSQMAQHPPEHSPEEQRGDRLWWLRLGCSAWLTNPLPHPILHWGSAVNGAVKLGGKCSPPCSPTQRQHQRNIRLVNRQHMRIVTACLRVGHGHFLS